jgi:hypothetical protein
MQQPSAEGGPRNTARTARQNYGWYLPIVVVIGSGYLAGGVLSFGVQFLHCLPAVQGHSARLTLVLFGCGMLGGSVLATRYWAVDMEQAIENPGLLPHALDCFGYATTIVGGGIVGVVFYLALRSGLFLTTTAEHVPELRLSAAVVIAFTVGCFNLRSKIGWKG